MEDCHSNIHALMTDEKSAKVNSPSTGEIVASLRSMQNSAQVVLDSGFGTHDGESDMVYRKRRDLAKSAADRLELLESELLQKTQELESIMRCAESAKRDRNVAIKVLSDYEDALFDEKDSAYNEGYSDGYQDGTKGI